MKLLIQIIDFVARYILPIASLIVSVVVIWWGADLKKQMDVKFAQYESMSKIHEKTIRTLYDLVDYLDELMINHGIPPGEEDKVISRMTSDEKLKVNGFIKEINISLAQMFVVMPDKEYQQIRNAIKQEKKKLQDIRYDMLIAMRQAQFPDTKIREKTDIRFFYKLK